IDVGSSTTLTVRPLETEETIGIAQALRQHRRRAAGEQTEQEHDRERVEPHALSPEDYEPIESSVPAKHPHAGEDGGGQHERADAQPAVPPARPPPDPQPCPPTLSRAQQRPTAPARLPDAW